MPAAARPRMSARMVEEGVYEYAPDVTSLVILGLEEPAIVRLRRIGKSGWPSHLARIGNRCTATRRGRRRLKLSFTARTRTDHAKRTLPGIEQAFGVLRQFTRSGALRLNHSNTVSFAAPGWPMNIRI